MHALMAELKTPPRMLVGLGLGASVALAYLEVAPSAARAALTHVVLHTPAYCPAAIRPAFRWGVRLVGAGPVFAVAQRLLRRPDVLDWYLAHAVGGPNVPAEDVRLLREDFRRASLPVLRGLAGDVVRADFRPLLRRLATPVLAIVAENDPFIYPGAVERLTTLLPSARVVVQREVGHGWTDAAIAEQCRLLAEFLG
jgi:pimeloyl-ACP methyl ester carboxylesterase